MLKDDRKEKDPSTIAGAAPFAVEPVVEEAPDEAETAYSTAPPSTERLNVLNDAQKVLSDHICDQLNMLMSEKLRSAPLEFGTDAKALIRRAWELADLLNSRNVLSFHLFAAICKTDLEATDALGSIVGRDPSWMFAGAVLRTGLLRNAPAHSGNFAMSSPSEQVLRWIAEAGAHAARVRPERRSLRAIDLVDVLRSPDADPKVRDLVGRLAREAAKLGREPSEYVKTRHEVESAHWTLRQFRSDTTERFAEVRKQIGGVADKFASVNSALQGFEAERSQATQRASAIDLTALQSTITSQSNRIQNSVREVAARHDGALAAVDRRAAVVEEKATTLEAHAADIKRHLAPPSAGWLAASVLAVLALGVGAGLMMVP